MPCRLTIFIIQIFSYINVQHFKPEYEDCMDSLCSYVRRQLRRATMEKFDVECDSSQPIPYVFLTPKGQEIDLRLFSRDIMRKALPILIGILERETRGWFLHFRERLIAELREKKMTDSEIEEVCLHILLDFTVVQCQHFIF